MNVPTLPSGPANENVPPARQHPHHHHWEDLKKPSGIWQIVQAVLTALVVIIGGYWSAVAKESAAESREQSRQQTMALITLQTQMSMVQGQLGAMSNVPSAIERIETKIGDDRQRITDLEQTRRLK